MSDAFVPAYFDPLSTTQLEAIICGQFERQPLLSLKDPVPTFNGSGLYAIYYVGRTHPLYGKLAHYKIPVYAGQARSHVSATGVSKRELRPLRSRIREHRRSIEHCEGLDQVEFAVRLLLMPDVHADLGENGLRVGYQPVWNSVLKGFGSHEQGSTTRQSKRSEWDTVHQGRKRTFGATTHDADKLARKVRTHIDKQIATYDSLPWHDS
ncbi:Eco29kI restriction endonuclease [Amycolatopsis marina]|uniref:Eco29kI restriction endonuclease n=1 Tax=Amycolatopsis marina TaxID=490629 RepID=A0A1I1CG66_9PSEU|nr:Eco29kI family restriction endonuclease [Amycolatopsis marina]SFB61681.1 Eco29kI restriction endonuclease [Amycolatopsis marina]